MKRFFRYSIFIWLFLLGGLFSNNQLLSIGNESNFENSIFFTSISQFKSTDLLPNNLWKIFNYTFCKYNLHNGLIGYKQFNEGLKRAGFSLKKYGAFNSETNEQEGDSVVGFHPGDYIVKCNGELNKILKGDVRKNLSRVLVAKEINRFARRNKLKHVRAPKKYIYRLPQVFNNSIRVFKRCFPNNRSKLNDRNWIVVCEKIDIDTSKTIKDVTDEQLAEIIKVSSHVGFCDFKFYDPWEPFNSNVVFDKKGKIVFLDTVSQAENMSNKLSWCLDSLPYMEPLLAEAIIATYLIFDGKKTSEKTHSFYIGRKIWKILHMKDYFLDRISRDIKSPLARKAINQAYNKGTKDIMSIFPKEFYKYRLDIKRLTKILSIIISKYPDDFKKKFFDDIDMTSIKYIK